MRIHADQSGTSLPRFPIGHTGLHSSPFGRVRCRQDNTMPVLCASTNSNCLISQLGILVDLDRRIKAVQVAVKDNVSGHVVPPLYPFPNRLLSTSKSLAHKFLTRKRYVENKCAANRNFFLLIFTPLCDSSILFLKFRSLQYIICVLHYKQITIWRLCHENDERCEGWLYCHQPF